MSDLLAVVSSEAHDSALLAELERRPLDRITVLLEGPGLDEESDAGRARRDRMARLLHVIEQRTGAVVVGLAGDRDQLHGWRFDREVRIPA